MIFKIRRNDMELHPRIHAIDVSGMGGILIFLVRGEKTALIDTGPKMPFPMAMDRFPEKDVPPVLQVLPPYLKNIGMTLADIDIILNTHIHFDHTAGNAAIKASSNAEIFIHEEEAIYFKEPELLFEHEIRTIIEIILGKEHLEEEKRNYLEELTGPGPYVAVDGTFRDGDVIELGAGIDLKVLHLPGHTQGSVGFYWEDEGMLLAGDAMQGVCGHGGGLPILDDPAAFVDSLERVKNLPIKTLVHAHLFQGLTTPPRAILPGAEINQYLDECSEFMRILKKAAEKVAPDFSERPFIELYDEVIDELPDGVGFRKWNEMPRQFFSPATLLHCIRQLDD
jgi:glyoxylase-like metal-dependent hydrolase (beta-lactamase superfamily II)